MSKVWMDAHCHLSDSAFDLGRDILYADLLKQNILGLVLAGTDPADWAKQKALNPPPYLKIARVFGLHPWNVELLDDASLEQGIALLTQELQHSQGLGELGLDYFRAKGEASRQKQKKWFEAQLDISPASHPLILHVVKGHHDSLPILKRRRQSYRGLVHCFWAHADVAKAYIDLGFCLSIPPRILKEDPHQLLTKIDRRFLVFETDTPFLNATAQCLTPILIKEILRFASQRWQEDIDETVERQSQILCELFPILKGH